MTIKITIYGDNAQAVLNELRGLLGSGSASAPVAVQIATAPEATAETAPPEKEKKPRKPREEKAEAPKAETPAPAALAPSTYTLQQVIDRSREIAGDGSDIPTLDKIKNLNISFGISRVRELPADKLDAYMAELQKTFPPKGAAEGLF